MNRTEELRQQIITQLETAIIDCERFGNDEYGQAPVHLNIITARRTVELLKKLEVPIEATWRYYTNDEGRPRWRCGNCGKIIRHGAHEKKRCSCCGAHMRTEA